MKWQFIFTGGWWRPKRRSATQSREEVGDVNNQDELLKRRVAETIKRVEADIPEPLRPYLTYRGPTPEPLGAKWFPRELTIEAPGQEPQRVEVYQDGYGFLYARIYEAK
jgi:hypothetical protein